MASRSGIVGRGNIFQGDSLYERLKDLRYLYHVASATSFSSYIYKECNRTMIAIGIYKNAIYDALLRGYNASSEARDINRHALGLMSTLDG